MRIIARPSIIEHPKHGLMVSVTGFAQRRLLPISRMLNKDEAMAYANGHKLIVERAQQAVPLTAVCQCGAIDVQVSSGARHVFTCHCTMCAVQNKTHGGAAPTWTAVSREHCLVRGALEMHFSSSLGRRGNCAQCGDAIFMDYSAVHTLYICGASPAPADLARTEEEASENKLEPIADADIFWKDRQPGAIPTSRTVFDDMPLGKMGFVRDPGRSLEALQSDP